MNLLTKLTEANKTFSIIELGCGLPVAHALMQQPGASRVITMASCPYNKEYQSKMTILDWTVTRSVSLEVVQELLQNLRDASIGESFHVAYSIQAGTSAKIAHGYVGICIGYEAFIYHVTLGKSVAKHIAGVYMEALVDDIINHHVFNRVLSVIDSNGVSLIDGAWSNLNVAMPGGFKFDPSILPNNFGTFCWAAGQWSRVVDVFRQLQGGLCIIKGSFNPIHDGHKQLIESAKRFTDMPLLSMTTETLGGKKTTVVDLVQRAKDSCCVCIIDSHNPYIKDVVADLEQWDEPTKKRTTHLFMGIDVFMKFDITDVDDDVKVHVYHRNCTVDNITFYESKYATLSSTAIREAK